MYNLTGFFTTLFSISCKQPLALLFGITTQFWNIKIWIFVRLIKAGRKNYAGKGKMKKQQAEMKTKSISHGHGELTLSVHAVLGVDLRINVFGAHSAATERRTATLRFLWRSAEEKKRKQSWSNLLFSLAVDFEKMSRVFVWFRQTHTKIGSEEAILWNSSPGVKQRIKNLIRLSDQSVLLFMRDVGI